MPKGRLGYTGVASAAERVRNARGEENAARRTRGGTEGDRDDFVDVL